MNMSPDDYWVIAGTVDGSIIPRFLPKERADICGFFRENESLESIAKRYLGPDDNLAVMITAIRLILIQELWDIEYKRLSYGKSGRKQKEAGKWIHSQSKAQKSSLGAQGAAAMGRQPYSREEEGEIIRLAWLQKNIKWKQRFYANKIADALHEKFPEKPKRTPKAISNFLSLHVKNKKTVE